jgi:hypothetical protein
MSDVEGDGRAAPELLLRDDNHHYGCAESTLVALEYLDRSIDTADPSAEMMLNGGVAYGGCICGAVSRAAMAADRFSDTCTRQIEFIGTHLFRLRDEGAWDRAIARRGRHKEGIAYRS